MAGRFSAYLHHVTVALLVLQLALSSMMVIASDADPEQDFCVADLASTTLVNGFVCKSAAAVMANDFVFHGLATPVTPKTQPEVLSLQHSRLSFPASTL
ncbi:hypothetical protein BDL97_16G000800 [Sphagnum fallax]|nr:hypothetical protein BDL97_16G000800 [Sphagnum fallax]